MSSRKTFGRVAIASLVLAGVAAGSAAADPYIFRHRGLPSLPAGGGGPGGNTPQPPAPLRFTPPAQPASASVETGEDVDVVIGSYEGDPSRWSCDPVAAASWLSCGFEGGSVRLTGTPPGTASLTAAVTVRTQGAAYPVSVPVTVSAPVPASVAFSHPDLHVPVGKESVLLVGTYTGSATGLACASNRTDLPFLSCRFEQGKVLLVANPTAAISRHHYLRVTKGATVVKEGSYHYLSAAAADYPAGDAQTLAPRAATATVHNRDLSAVSGKPVDLLVGTYTGGEGGWLCYGGGRDLPTGMTCEAGNGEIRLKGTASGFTRQQNYVRIVRDGRVVRETSYFFLNTAPADYPLADADFATPRAASATFVNRDVSAVSGKPLDLLVGTYTGGEGGLLCYGGDKTLPTGMSCEAKGGEIRLKGSVSGQFHQHNYLRFVRDGRVSGESSFFYIYGDPSDYPTADADFASPRAAAATFRNQSVSAVSGQPIDILVGTYTGGEGGLLCYGGDKTLPAGMTCEAKDGEIRLKGSVSGRINQHNYLRFVRDGRVYKASSYAYINADPTDYPTADANFASPRAGGATFTLSNTSIPHSTAVDRVVGTYTGGEGGWLCYGGDKALPAGMTCEAKDGEIRLKGTTPSSGSHFNYLRAVRDGNVVAQGSYFRLTFN